jgi:hypothetical protein
VVLKSQEIELSEFFQALLMNGDPTTRMSALREALRRGNTTVKAGAASVVEFFSATTPVATQATGTPHPRPCQRAAT